MGHDNGAMVSTDELLATADHCMLAYRVDNGPAMTPLACWSDGGGVWMTTSRHAAKTAALRRDARCGVWIAPPDGDGAGVVIDGTARIYEPSDPISFALHAPTVAAASAALAMTHRRALAGYVLDLPRLPAHWQPQSRVLVRVRIDRARSRRVPDRVTGVGPVLPTELPSTVRRALTGARHVTLATQRGDALSVQPAVWGAGFRLDVGTTIVPEAEIPACIVVEHAPGQRPSTKVGLMLRGSVDAGLTFTPVRVVWWEGFSGGAAAVRAPTTASGIVLPD